MVSPKPKLKFSHIGICHMRKIFQKAFIFNFINISNFFFFFRFSINFIKFFFYYDNKEAYEDFLQVTRFEKDWVQFYKHPETVELNAISYLYETICDRINENIDSIISKMKRDPEKIQRFFDEYISVCLQNDSLQILDSLIV